ncbi:hypothetical protein [Xanthomonas sp. MUS 060]|uniref:hypothetical protein n=1 Tax=Xanthomonas sp. MUS 060 TaxID=1588031 RepID=UPI000A7A37F9|nr:hypothetical protein [Xanthomonas sp. MUS 060]
MATKKQIQTKRLTMVERAKEQMEKHFPDHDRLPLWNRKENDGYSTIPRTLPIAMQAIDALSKGNPGGHTLFCLWARAPDHPFIVIDSPTTYAAEAGFTGERASDTWRRRMKQLRELGFIRSKKGTSGDFHYVLLLNPNIALNKLKEAGHLQESLVDRFDERLNEIGAKRDLQEYKEKLEDLGEDECQESEEPKENITVRPEKTKRRAIKKAGDSQEEDS